MDLKITIYFIEQSNGTFLFSTPAVRGHWWHIDNFEFINSMLDQRQKKNIKKVNQRRVFYNVCMPVLNLYAEYSAAQRIIDPEKYYIVTSTIDGGVVDYKTVHSTEAEAKDRVLHVASLYAPWVAKGSEILRRGYMYIEKYYTKEYSERRRKEILEKELKTVYGMIKLFKS